VTPRLPLLAAVLGLAACHAAKVPDFSYFRLPPPEPRTTAQPAQRLAVPIVVDAFAADGLYSDQSLIYALDSGARELRQYHYQLWVDPPTRMLQRRLIVRLREAGLAPLVLDDLPVSRPALRVNGVILRLDRVPRDSGGWQAVVALKLRATAPDGTPLLDRLYHADVVADGGVLRATVDAFGAAVDRIFGEFEGDLEGVGRHVPER
jgi:ABC-type uncharacterized transport system auxiliary subunit